MPRRRTRPKRRIIRFYTDRMPKIMPWLDNQENQSMSVYMLIRMAQHMYGNQNWPDVAQSLADNKIVNNLYDDNKSTISRPLTNKQKHLSTKSVKHAKDTDIKRTKPTKEKHRSSSHKTPNNVKSSNNSSSNNQANNSISTSDLKDLLG